MSLYDLCRDDFEGEGMTEEDIDDAYQIYKEMFLEDLGRPRYDYAREDYYETNPEATYFAVCEPFAQNPLKAAADLRSG